MKLSHTTDKDFIEQKKDISLFNKRLHPSARFNLFHYSEKFQNGVLTFASQLQIQSENPTGQRFYENSQKFCKGSRVFTENIFNSFRVIFTD